VQLRQDDFEEVIEFKHSNEESRMDMQAENDPEMRANRQTQSLSDNNIHMVQP
jgi:hypothetical protein